MIKSPAGEYWFRQALAGVGYCAGDQILVSLAGQGIPRIDDVCGAVQNVQNRHRQKTALTRCLLLCF